MGLRIRAEGAGEGVIGEWGKAFLKGDANAVEGMLRGCGRFGLLMSEGEENDFRFEYVRRRGE